MRKIFSKSKIKSGNFLDPDEILADSLGGFNSSFGAEGKMERSISKTPSYVFLFLMMLGVVYLSFKAFDLQIAQGDTLLDRSEENRFLTRPIFPPRGIIYDSKGIPLVENIPSFGLVFQKNSFLNRKGDLKKMLVKLQETLGTGPEDLYNLGFPKDYDLKKIPSQLIISQDISLDLLVAVSSRLDVLPGIEIFESYKRLYKNPRANSALIGYIGKISAEDLERDSSLLGEEITGKNGLEFYYDKILRGRGGKKIIEIDSRGRETRFKTVQKPEEGEAIHLTIDGELQKKAYELLNHYTEGRRAGSLVAVDPRNGDIRALVSYPGFDSNIFSYGISPKEYAKIIKDPLKPLFNRAIAGEFPSGSVIKPLIAAAVLQEKIIDPNKKIHDPGYIRLPNPYGAAGAIFVDWRPHGWVNLYDAIALSANVYFYTVGGGYGDQKGLGVEKINKYIRLFGLGEKLGLDLPGEKQGFIPSPENKKLFDPDNPVWRIGDTYNLSIGQGGLKVTPLQMAMAASAIANGGTLFHPHVLKTDQPEIIRQNFIDLENLKKVIKGMRQTVTDGTAKTLQSVPVEVAAKTGTAQSGNKKLNHAWGMAFAPAEKPELAIITMVEYGGEGSSLAIPLERDLLKWYFADRYLPSETATSTPENP